MTCCVWLLVFHSHIGMPLASLFLHTNFDCILCGVEEGNVKFSIHIIYMHMNISMNINKNEGKKNENDLKYGKNYASMAVEKKGT